MYWEIILIILFILIGLLFTRKYVVSLTTIPSRIGEIKRTIDSLKNQILRPQKIIINIPKIYERFGTSITKIPDFLKNDPMVHINIIEEDYGPATKMLGVLNMDIPPNMIVLICDDDVVYKKSWSLRLLVSVILCGKCVYSLNGKREKKPTIFGNNGWGFYRRSVNKDDILRSYYKNKQHCNMVDDEFFTNYFNKKLKTKKDGNLYSGDVRKVQKTDGLHQLAGVHKRKPSQQKCNKNFN
jgi:hypothetical protein